jgi:hypothetical protein
MSGLGGMTPRRHEPARETGSVAVHQDREQGRGIRKSLRFAVRAVCLAAIRSC